MVEQVILVDKNDCEIGTEEKIKAHIDAKLHRAFSIFVFNKQNELLLQKRAAHKYHAGGLWTNTCCSHPRPKEELSDAVHRRLIEEMGFDCELKHLGKFEYKVKFLNGLTEHEIDHVFVGKFEGTPKINTEEADDFKWINHHDLFLDITKNPANYTPWFIIALEKFFKDKASFSKV